MARFAWHGTDERGRAKRGECAAPGPIAAAAELRARGMAPLSMDRVDFDPLPRGLTTADAFTQFNRNLAEMTSIGLPLPEAIREIASGFRQGRFRRGLEQIEAALREGKSLDAAVGDVQDVFPPHYRWMVKAGIAAGNLPAVLSAVARNTEGIRIARRTLLEALFYPILIIAAAVLLSGVALTLFVPYYRQLAALQTVMPKGIELVVQAFDSAGLFAAVVVGAVGLLCAGIWMLRRTITGDRLLRRVPFVGRIRRHLMMARLLGSLGVMLRSNVPLPKALPVAMGASGSLELARAAERLAGDAAEGRGLGEILAGAPGFEAVASFLKVAERSGEAPQAAGEIADLLTEQAMTETETLFVLLVPAALLVAGVVVGGLLVSIVSPYIQLLESLRL